MPNKYFLDETHRAFRHVAGLLLVNPQERGRDLLTEIISLAYYENEFRGGEYSVELILKELKNTVEDALNALQQEEEKAKE